MCLAIPGRIVEISGDDGLQRLGIVDVDGRRHTVNLAMVPEAGVGDHVVTHSGFALRIADPPQPGDFEIFTA